MKLNKKGVNAVLFGAVAASSLLLVACGGGGGGGSSSTVNYTGVTTAAVIADEASATNIADSVISTASSDPTAALIVGVEAAGDVTPVEQLRGIADMAKRLAIAPEETQTLAGASFSGESLPACSGSATASGTYDDYTGDFYSMTVTFTNYVMDIWDDGTECSTEKLNGRMSVTFSYDDYQLINGMTITLTDYSVTDLTTGQNYAFNGSMAMTMDNFTYESSFSMTMNFRGTDGVVYRAENYTVQFDSYDNMISISGRLYDPEYGYVDLSTAPQFGYSGCYYGYPSSGVLRIDGANNGYIEIDANTGNCDTYALTWSADGTNPVAVIQNWY